MSAIITRRGGGIGGGSVVTGEKARTAARIMAIPDLAGKKGFVLVAEDYGLDSISESYMEVTAIYYLDGEYTMSCQSGEYLCEFTSGDSFKALSFDSATGRIILDDNNIEEVLRFKSSTYYGYVGW